MKLSKYRPIRIYTKVPCPYCVAATRFIENLGLVYEEIDLTNEPEQLMELKNRYGWTTVPMIFFGDDFIGGYTDMKALWDQGHFWERLKILDGS